MTVRDVRAHGAKTVTSSTKRFRHSTVSASSSHAAARMILAAVASYDLQAFDALQRVNARGTFVVNQKQTGGYRPGDLRARTDPGAATLTIPNRSNRRAEHCLFAALIAE
jgi:hypothetical protein